MEIPKELIDALNNSLDKNQNLSMKKFSLFTNDTISTWLEEHKLTPRQVLYMINNNISEIPKCPTCGNLVYKFNTGKKFCSNKCAQLDPEIAQKRIDGILKSYGVTHSKYSKELNDKAKQTCLKKYGVEYTFQAKEVKDKIKQTNLERYGVSCALQNSDVAKKRAQSFKENCLKKHGVVNTSCLDSVKEKIVKTRKTNFYEVFKTKLNTKNIELLMDKDTFVNSNSYKYKCKKCNKEFTLDTCNTNYVHCPTCKFTFSVSKSETIIINFIKMFYDGEIIQSCRTVLSGNRELDIYIPEKKLAIEFNGSYWHSELYKSPNYHQSKSIECKEKGIRLIHVSEHDWNNKQEIVKSIILSALGIYNQKIYARKCTLQEIDAFEYRNFLELNHIQGSINSKYKYGLFYQGELVSVFGYGQSRFKKGELELHRFCSKIYTQIVGGFSKFLKNIVNAKLYSYVDLSYFDGSGYFKNGFVLEGITKPSYVYIKENEILSRIQCQKHKLEKILENFDENGSEHLNMLNNGYVRFYDCGNLKVSYRND